MSVQIFLLGKVLGIEEFLFSATAARTDDERALVGRSHWVTLLSEVLPRALLAELGLAKVLLGASGGGQFLLLLPEEARGDAGEFLHKAAADIDQLSQGALRLIWAATENLGEWPIVRRRLSEEIERLRSAPAAGCDGAFWAPFDPPEADEEVERYFAEDLVGRLHETHLVGWSPELPGRVLVGQGKHSWALGSSADAIPFAGHAAPGDDPAHPADRRTLGARAEGKPLWGVLRGDVDNFGIRLRRAESIEEHVELSVIYKQFFAGELEVACSMPEFWRKVTLLYSGGDDFAVYGAWDALIVLATGIQRMFHRLSEEGLKEFPGPEGKTISMALALAPEPDAPLASVYQEAGRRLEIAKSSEKDCFHLLGRTLPWRQMNYTSELKDDLVRMVREFGCPASFLSDVAMFYKDTPRLREIPFERPWRLHRRINRLVEAPREREFQKLRQQVFQELAGKSGGQRKLRPTGRAALEWARLTVDIPQNQSVEKV
jgi:CRISPR-associated protein Csm1